jgi:hypothetical protein
LGACYAREHQQRQVYDSIYDTGTKDQTPITYNQGTFIGAANYLGYTNGAIRAANFTRNSMGRRGLLPNYEAVRLWW